jgi:hypothetical protein
MTSSVPEQKEHHLVGFDKVVQKIRIPAQKHTAKTAVHLTQEQRLSRGLGHGSEECAHQRLVDSFGFLLVSGKRIGQVVEQLWA